MCLVLLGSHSVAGGFTPDIVEFMAHDVFISYSSEDKDAGIAVCEALERHGVRCWMAPRDIVPGEGWAKSILGAISRSRAMVLLLTAHANVSPQIEREVERAVHKRIPIVPVRIEDVMPGDALEYFLSAPHWLDAFGPPLEQHLDRLAEAVRSLLETRFAEKGLEDEEPPPVLAETESERAEVEDEPPPSAPETREEPLASEVEDVPQDQPSPVADITVDVLEEDGRAEEEFESPLAPEGAADLDADRLVEISDMESGAVSAGVGGLERNLIVVAALVSVAAVAALFLPLAGYILPFILG